MIKKLTAIICSIIMLMSITFAYAEETPVVFYNAASNYEISGLDDIENVYAKASFVPDYTGDAKVITARYDSDGIFLDSQAEPISVTANVQKEITTTSVSTKGAEKIKVFVWDSMTGLKPLVTFGEILSGPNNEKIPVQKFVTAFKNTNDYLYRVGNKNTVALGSLFDAREGTIIESETVSVTVESVDETVSVSGTFTQNATSWENSTIQFTGTGAVKVTVTDEDACIPTELYLEVIDAKNVTSYGELTNANCVLLNDITMSDNGAHYMSNCTLYGNGFTFDVTAGKNTGGTMSENYLISLNNATLDNVQIIGAVYTQYGAQVSSAYNNPVVLSNGNDVIANCYIANCSAPVRVKDGNLEVINSTLKGGNFANLDIRGGNVTLTDVTTINQVGLNDLASDGSIVAGFGIVVYYENVLNTTTINIEGTLAQYNHLSSEDARYIKDDSAKMIFDAMFDYDELIYTDGDIQWANPAIVSMTGDVGDANISDVEGYVGKNVTFLSKTGYVHTKVSAPMNAPDYESVAQYEIAPSYSFDYSTKNYLAKTEGSNDYCYAENGKVNISFDQGETFDWDTEILTATKVGKTLDYTVSMNGTDYTDKKITFSESGNYDVVYTYTDLYNYDVNENGVVTYDVTYTKTVPVSVSVIAPETKKAEFTLGSGTATEKITVGDKTYISAAGVSHNNSTWSYITVSGTKIYYPIVETTIVSKKTAYFPVFNNVVSITDYADGGTGAAVTYNSSTTTMPAGLSVVKGIYKPFADISSNWSTLNDTQLTYNGASSVFKYAGSADASSTPIVYSNKLCFQSPEVSNARDEYITIAQYSYTDETNTTYYYYVGYHMAAKGKGSDSCVAPETLITLADGSYKRIDELTYDDKLLVWDFYNGEYTVVPPMIIDDHGYGENTVIKLTFDDGTEVKAVNLHQFFDADLNKLVNIDGDSVSEYLNHSFVKRDADGYKTVKLVDYEISEEYVKAYGVLSAVHYNILVNDMISADYPPGTYGLMTYFEVGDNLTYDKEKMQADIEKYGLYSYEDFTDYMTLEEFDAMNMKYMKISVGKGYYTYDGIISLIETYLR